MMSEVRNAVLLPDGRIDCEVLHPRFGWIPYTANANDPDANGRAIFAAALQSGPADYIAPPPPAAITEAQALSAERAAMVCSRFQAKAALLAAGMLDDVEAVMATADPLARMAWADATEFRRNSPTIAALAIIAGLTETQVDDLFRVAITITA